MPIPDLRTLALVCATAFLVALAMTPALRSLLRRASVVDEVGHRSSHAVPTPRGGGLAVLFAVACGAAIWLLSAPGALVWVVATAVTAGLVGWVEDVRGISIGKRLASQLVLASVMAGGVFLSADSEPAGVLAFASVLATAVAVAGFANVFNFMDGIDGIAAITATAAGLTWAASGLFLADGALVLLGVSLASACLGFIFFNRHPATIFLGDVGSLFLGWLAISVPVAVMAIHSAAAALLLLLPTVPFGVDAVMTMRWRYRRSEKLTEPHRSHLYQVWARQEGHAHVAVRYGAASYGLGALAVVLVVRDIGVLVAGGTLVVAGVVLGSLWAHVRSRQERVTAAA